MDKIIYADNAATTKISKEVLEVMLPYLSENFGNPSAIYSAGRVAKKAIETARRQVAAAIGAKNTEIYFTGSGTEADNWAIKAVCKMQAACGKTELVTTNIEHPAILKSIEALEKEGFTAKLLPVDSGGFVTAEQVSGAITDKTALVSVMYANNEIGTIQPIAEIGAVCRKKGVLFHTDAVQAAGHIKIDVEAQNIDLLSLSGHKLHACKGVGALYLRSGIRLPSFIDGGGQERTARSGTENVAAVAGFGYAAEQAAQGIEIREEYIERLSRRLISGIIEAVPGVRQNGGRESRLAGNVNLLFEGVDGEALLMLLDMAGICASSGSACASGSTQPSHVLLAIGLSPQMAKSSIRFSLNEDNTIEEIDRIIKLLPPLVAKLRDKNPAWRRAGERKTDE